MIFGMTYYQICWYFLWYSFLGWIVEVVFHAVTQGKVINRGFLNGPVCPIYGFGVVSVFCLNGYFSQLGSEINDLYLFFAGMILSTSLELIGGWFMDRCFHARWWDYSDRPFNFRGYICLEFSIIWGFCILLVVRIMHIYVKNYSVVRSESKLGWYVLLALYAIYFADMVVTVMMVRGLNRNLQKLDDIQKDMRFVSDRLSKRIGERTINAVKKVEEAKVQAELGKAELREKLSENSSLEESLEKLQSKRLALQERFDELSEKMESHTIIGQGRLLNAFPSLKHRDYPEVLKLLKEKRK